MTGTPLLAATYATLGQQTPPAPPAPTTTLTPFPGGPKVTVAPNGQMTVIAPDGAVTILERDGRMRRIDPEGRVTQSSGPPAAEEQMPDGAFVSIMGLSILSAFVVGRWWTMRKFRKQGAGGSAYAAGIPAELDGRIDRIEHAIESVAIEVERISEGQRFTTRLLTDRGDNAAAIPAAHANEAGGGRR